MLPHIASGQGDHSGIGNDLHFGSPAPHALWDPARSKGGPGHVRFRLTCRQCVEVRRLRFVTHVGSQSLLERF